MNPAPSAPIAVADFIGVSVFTRRTFLSGVWNIGTPSGAMFFFTCRITSRTSLLVGIGSWTCGSTYGDTAGLRTFP